MSWLRAGFENSTLLGLLLIAAIWIFAHFYVEARRENALDLATSNHSNLATAVAGHVSRSVKEVDAALLFLRQARLREGSGFRLADYANTAYFKNDLIQQVGLVGPDGMLIESNLGPMLQPLDLSDREHVRVHTLRASDELYISEPVLGRVSGRWSIQFTRRLHDEHGRYAGVIVASVSPEKLSDFYTSFDIGRGAITLLGDDGIVRARGSSDGVDAMGKECPLMRRMRPVATRNGCFKAVATFTREFSLICPARVEASPLKVVVSNPVAQVLSEAEHLRKQLLFTSALLSLLCLPIIGAAILRRRKLSDAINEVEDARRAVAAAARDLRLALENMGHGIMFLDQDGCVIVSNDKAATLLGLPRFSGDEPVSIDKMIRFLEFDPPAPPSGLESLPKAMALMRPGVVACAGPGGRILEIRTRVLEDGGYVRTIDDVTQSYNAARQLAGARDEAQAASRARAAFLARMSHEIRTPLHAVLGYSRLLDREALPSQAKQIAHDIREASAHLLAIVDDILDFSTIDVGRMRVEIGAVDVRETLEIARKTALVLLGYKPVEVRVHVADDVPALVRSDRRRILQVLTNLVSNAAKFTDSGTIELRAQRIVSAGADRLLIEVRDTGCGVWPAEVPALFEAFSRAGATAHKPGAGLGLAIVREIVRGLGGEIEVESAPGKGSNFFFSLPAEAAEGADRAVGAPLQDEGGGLDILIADDSRSSLRLMQLMLEKRNHRVVTALNGWEAVEACARQSFDLVFLDVQMPVMDGLQAAAAVRRRETVSGRRTLISALTAQVLAEDQAAARAAGMDYILRKPFEEHELDAILKEASLRKKEALAAA